MGNFIEFTVELVFGCEKLQMFLQFLVKRWLSVIWYCNINEITVIYI